MMKRTNIKKWIVACTAGILLAMQSLTALAATHEESTRTGSIVIKPGDQDQGGAEVLEGTYTLYRVGDVNAADLTNFAPTDAFRDSSVEFNRETLASSELPAKLLEFARAHAVQAVRSDIPAGETTDGLSEGLYLISQQALAPGYRRISPFLVILPQVDEQSLTYDITARPKTEKLGAVTYHPTIEKRIVDRNGNAISREESFRFTVTPEGSAPMPAGTEAGQPRTLERKGAGNVELGEISFAGVAGPFTYRIREVNDGLRNYTYDETEYVLTLQVVRDEAADVLKVESSIKKADGTIVDRMSFTNTYRSSGGGHTGGGGGGRHVRPSAVKTSGTPTTGPGEVLGAVREAAADIPVAKVLGAVRSGIRTSDSGNIVLDGIALVGAVLLLGAWGILWKKRK
jgi:pilin isopeptide linkage protein